MTENLGEMVARLQSLRDGAKEMRDAAGKLELEIIQEMEANDQTLFEDTRFKARIPVKREYDVNSSERCTPKRMRSQRKSQLL